MALGRDILAAMGVGEDGHPLGMIGLSPEILKVGLTDTELYSVSRRFAKSLLAEVHEDRVSKTPRTELLQTRFSRAMVTLRSETAFDVSLQQLRQQESTRSSELAVARRDRNDYKARARAAEAEAEQLRVALTKAKTQLRVLRRDKTLLLNQTDTRVARSDKMARENLKESARASHQRITTRRAALERRRREVSPGIKKLEQEKGAWESKKKAYRAKIEKMILRVRDYEARLRKKGLREEMRCST